MKMQCKKIETESSRHPHMPEREKVHRLEQRRCKSKAKGNFLQSDKDRADTVAQGRINAESSFWVQSKTFLANEKCRKTLSM